MNLITEVWLIGLVGGLVSGLMIGYVYAKITNIGFDRMKCETCKTKPWETECYAHFKMSGKSMLPTTQKLQVPDYCK